MDTRLLPLLIFSIAATYTLIYSFLSKRSHVKAAQAVKKAAKDLISLEDITLEDPQLDTIVDEWRKSHPKLDAAIKAPSLYVTSTSSSFLHDCKLTDGSKSRLNSESECESEY